MKNVSKRQISGFTLIELLVVVLIIGILASVALPQYEVAVLKSRMTAALPLMRALKDAEERYYLVNNRYLDQFDGLDLDVPEKDLLYTNRGIMKMKNGTYIDVISATDEGGDVVGGYFGESDGKICFIRMFFDHSPSPGVITCGEDNIPNYTSKSLHSKCLQVCKSMGY